MDALPPHPLRDTVRTLMRSSCPGTPLAALAALARTYCRESSPETGTTLAAALHALGRQLAPKLPDGDLVAVALSQLATAHLGALARLARFDELVRFAGQYLAVLAPEDEEGAAVLRLFQLTATMALEREAAAAG